MFLMDRDKRSLTGLGPLDRGSHCVLEEFKHNVFHVHGDVGKLFVDGTSDLNLRVDPVVQTAEFLFATQSKRENKTKHREESG